MDFKLIKWFWVKASSTGLCSIWLIASLIANPLELLFGQEMPHSDLQDLHYHIVDMHTQYPKIEWDIEFPKVLSAKQMQVWKLNN
jgi:hypothetical protein